MKFFARGLAQRAPSKQELLARGHQQANMQVHPRPRECQVGGGRVSANREILAKLSRQTHETESLCLPRGEQCPSHQAGPPSQCHAQSCLELPFAQVSAAPSSHPRCFHHPRNNESPAISMALPCLLSQQSLSPHLRDDAPATRAGLVSLITAHHQLPPALLRP